MPPFAIIGAALCLLVAIGATLLIWAILILAARADRHLANMRKNQQDQ